MPLTDTAIRKAKATDNAQRLPDGSGLYLEIAPAGGKMVAARIPFRRQGKAGIAGHLPGYHPCQRARQARRSPQAVGGRR